MHPGTASIDCNSCMKWRYNLETGEQITYRDRPTPQMEIGPPCAIRNDACPKGKPFAKDLSDKNRMAYEHFRLCDATNSFPDDDIVRRNASVIRDVMARVKDHKDRKYLSALMRSGRKR